MILIEGQAALRNPSGPCGAEFLSSAQAKGVLATLQDESYTRLQNVLGQWRITDDIKIIQLYGSEVLAVTLNGEGVAEADREECVQNWSNAWVFRSFCH